ncbi:fimbrial usher protein StbD [Pantoea sp. AS142]|uniref:fimbrial usher protein StbD n=1 Tax=Pantoea sp. AS142 TaxID=3081292 RepID=UPI003017EE5B
MKQHIPLICLITSCCSLSVHAACVKVTSVSQLSATAIASGYTAASWTGSCDTCNGSPGLPSVISINSGSTIQPAGTLLASGTGIFTNGASRSGYGTNQILFRCDLSDADSLYEMYATNGDNNYAGKQSSAEVEGAYHDYIRNVATRITNLSTGEYYSRYWKQRQLTSNDWFQDSQYIYVPASAFSNVLYELFKISSTSYSVNNSAYYADSYSQPRGYIAFKGPGLSANNIQAGADSNSVYSGFYSQWPGAWGTYQQVTWIRNAFCQVSDYPSRVTLPPVSAASLQSGGSSSATFTISVECESGAVSGTGASSAGTANVAMGFFVNQPVARSAAQSMGLTIGTGALSRLLDNNYGAQGVASGVGIRIYRYGLAIPLLADRNTTGTGLNSGWIGFKDLLTLASEGYTHIYSGEFTASLEALPARTVTAGTVNAQLQVVISFQ